MMVRVKKSIRDIVTQSVKCCFLLLFGECLGSITVQAQKVVFARDFSPAEGLVIPQEKPYRDEICLNGLWELPRMERISMPAKQRRRNMIC